MARVKYLEKHEVAEELRWIYEKYGEEYGPFMNQVRVFAHRPVLLKHLMGMLLEMAEDSVLEKRHLEIALVTVSKLNECRYCVAHHVPRLVDAGLEPATAEKILDDDCPGLNELDTLVRDYATQVTLDSKRVSDSLVSRLRAFYSEEQVIELTFRIALCGFYNRFNEALRIDIEDGVIEDLMAKGGNVADLPMPLTEVSVAE